MEFGQLGILHGHGHRWDQTLSRRHFLGTTVVAAGATLTSGIWAPSIARAQALPGSTPRPIPGGVTTPFGVSIHHNPFPPGIKDPNEIGDFDGVVGVVHATGTGTGTNTATGATSRLLFVTDSGFMVGNYIGMDGLRHTGTFAFI